MPSGGEVVCETHSVMKYSEKVWEPQWVRPAFWVGGCFKEGRLPAGYIAHANQVKKTLKHFQLHDHEMSISNTTP